MNRRTFINNTALASAGLLLKNCDAVNKRTHILTFSFDDGFKKSFYKIADIHENYGLKACFNVIAAGHLPIFDTEKKWIPPQILGDFSDWNALKARGHEVMPHTWQHLNVTEISPELAKKNIDKCLAYFEKHLDGYDNKKAVYNFAYNASTPEIEAYVLEKVRAVRTGGWLVLKDTLVNAIPTQEKKLRLGCWGHGPDFCDDYVEQEINKFLKSEGGWLILNLHGLDEEGWGPIRSQYLDTLLNRLSKIDHLAVLPAGEVLDLV
ncbi:MAG: polysaccharide deacetylase family protein [Bacteroidota bacterium]